MPDKLLKEFRNRFHNETAQLFFCPGRVNLIGEHIDYNGGKVMPCAISSGTYLVIAKNADKKIRFQCMNFPEKAELHLQSSYSKTGKQWFNYPLGVINQLLQNGHAISGLDMLFVGDLPIGAGLSSSASIEVLTAFALNELYQFNISKVDIALLSKKSENEFIGVNCGIMDQFAVAMGQKDKAILLNCDTLEYEYLPFKTGEYSLIVINSRKQRSLEDSRYNERFAECGAALKLLKTQLDLQHLCDLDVKTFEAYRHLIDDSVLQKRALHVISENERVKEAAAALKSGDLAGFGKLMYASHQSLKELYEVSGFELDVIIDFCKTYSNCIGARMTGAGFGGSVIALVKKKSYIDFAARSESYYTHMIGYKPEIFDSEIGDGVTEIKF
ncbi:MAG: galactokinase [Chitinophagales bacterium]